MKTEPEVRFSLTVRCRLRELRGDRSLQQLADVCGIHRGTLSQLERGERLPRPRDVSCLAQVYGPSEGWWTVEFASPAVVPSLEIGEPPCVA